MKRPSGRPGHPSSPKPGAPSPSSSTRGRRPARPDIRERRSDGRPHEPRAGEPRRTGGPNAPQGGGPRYGGGGGPAGSRPPRISRGDGRGGERGQNGRGGTRQPLDRGGERERYYGERREGAYGERSRGYAGGRGRERRDLPFADLLRELQQQVSIDPHERFRLETTPDQLSTRCLDLLTPIGKGQRCLIVAPPKAGKTTLLQEVATAIHKNHPEVEVLVLLVDERPEEVTHFRRSQPAEVLAASSDQTAAEHVEIAEKALTRVLVPVLEGKDVVLLLDSITRLARAYNTNFQGIGRTLSGGIDATTMQVPRQIFGAARKIEGGGSLTILGTALVDTGSRMDEVIFQEFKGTGNMELVLSRQLFERRVFPCIDIKQSGTRKEEKLYDPNTVRAIQNLRRRLAERDNEQAMLELLELMKMYPTNELLLSRLM